MTLTELIEILEEMNNSSDDAGERTVLIVHQPHWPLQETVKGLWDPNKSGEREYVLASDPDDECHSCEVSVQGQMAWHHFEEELPLWTCDECTAAEEDAEPRSLYLVAGGHPEDLSPYGPRAAFREV